MLTLSSALVMLSPMLCLRLEFTGVVCKSKGWIQLLRHRCLVKLQTPWHIFLSFQLPFRRPVACHVWLYISSRCMQLFKYLRASQTALRYQHFKTIQLIPHFQETVSLDVGYLNAVCREYMTYSTDSSTPSAISQSLRENNIWRS